MFSIRLAIVCLITGSLALGQQGRGTIVGTVTDTTGASVPNAKITVTSVSTNLEYPTTTSTEGYYTVPNLLVGEYRVTAAYEGMKTVVRGNVILEVDQRAQVDFQLAPGAITESVEVLAQAPLVDTSTGTVGKVIENRRVQELPVNGRTALALVLLAPAVQSAFGPANSGFAARGVQLAGIKINGGPVATNNIVIDGLSSVNPYFPDINVNPSVEAVQEFRVQTNTMSAEYGFTLGGVVNLVTKAGGNDPHGSLYEFLRNDKLDANSWANNRIGARRDILRYNQFGGSLSGPVWLPKIYNGSNRSFFFFNYEGYRFRTGRTGFLTMPTQAYREGDFSLLRDSQGRQTVIYDPVTTNENPDYNPNQPITLTNTPFLRQPFPNNRIPADRMDQVAKAYLQFYPLPNRQPDDPFTNLNNVVSTVADIRNMDQYTTRADHRFSDANNLSFRYVHYNQYSNNGLSNNYPDPMIRERRDPFRGHNVVVSDIHTISPRVIHEIRLGVARQIFDFAAAGANEGLPQSLLGFPNTVPPDHIPIVANGLPSFYTNGQATIGRRGGLVWQWYDSIMWIKGNHSLKFGGEFRLIQGNNFQKGNPSGTFTFAASLTNNANTNAALSQNTGNAFATFLLGDVSSANVVQFLGESEVGKSYSGYIQDDWKVARRLTLNLGLRYDYQQQPYERRCGTSNFNPFAINPTNNLPGRTEYACIDYGRTARLPDKNDFAPRVGFAWDIFGAQNTVLRGGYSIFYVSNFSYRENFGQTNGFASVATPFSPPDARAAFFPLFKLRNGYPRYPSQPTGSALGPNLFASTQVLSHDEQYSPTPYSQQWNLSIQRQLPGSWLLDLTYSGNHGLHLPSGGYNLNQLDPAIALRNGATGSDPVPNPYAGRALGIWGANTVSRNQTMLPFPWLGGVTIRNPHLGNSIYHALLVSAEHRFSGGLTMLASYTWAKLISDSVINPLGTGFGDEQANEVGYQNGLYNRRAERSEDPTNIPQRFVLSAVYDLPFGKGRHFNINSRALDMIAGGWQLNTITTVTAGLPLIVRGASNGLANRPDILRSPELPDNFVDPRPELGILRFDPSAFVNPAPYTYGNTPRTISTVRTPGAFLMDVSLFKNFTITESTRLQFRAESFNLPNWVNPGAPNTSFTVLSGSNQNGNPALGRITSSRAGRNLQFALKFMF
jgi:outer membrane receptor protein involved in Fe transport